MLERWDRDRTFLESIIRREVEGADEFVFYDGPPFANGLPHYGHLLTGFVKDAVPRYQTMRGKLVHRRFGWDCHGLPAEVEAERELGIAGHPRSRSSASATSTTPAAPACSGTPRSGSGTSRARPAGSTSRTTTRRSTSTTWRASCGRSRRSGTRVSCTRGSRCWRTAGAARRRSATPRPAWTTCTPIARIPHSRSGSSSSTRRGSRPARCCSRGRPRRGRFRRTSPWPSAPTSTTRSSSTTTGS